MMRNWPKSTHRCVRIEKNHVNLHDLLKNNNSRDIFGCLKELMNWNDSSWREFRRHYFIFTGIQKCKQELNAIADVRVMNKIM